ncbi:unnamed protein product [Plutella xylostella]|uniref:(diamondback moth) hypothetical protein n=1 Tax=Plutella xylostella TaxID=51655 RepID=A0A8S4G4U6_PLUXY|nr:unnamed protein product [Plutella xylostella]
MAVFSYIFGLLIACLSYIVYQKYVNVYPSLVKKPDKRYDYIIVGAGTAGCVLAARLSEDPGTRVLLVEAGDQMGYFTKIPLTATAAQQGPNDWSVRTTPQKYSSFGMWNQTSLIPRGKGLGGSGHINFLLHGFGLPADYERWTQLGFTGWTHEALKPYFVKAFGTTDSEFDSEYCPDVGECLSAKAPMKLKLIESHNELLQVFQAASRMLGKSKVLFRRPTATVRDGIRHSTLDGYLKPALKRKNLHVLLKTQGVSIRFEDRKAVSLYILKKHIDLDNIFVNKEIIISAGAIKSPQLLIYSGIGPRETLRRLKLSPVAENEHVGANLHDHMNMPLYVSIKKPISITLAKVFSFSTVWDHFWKSKGFLSFPPVAGIEYQNNNTSALMLFSMGTASEKLLREISNYRPEVFRDSFPFHNHSSKEGFMFLSTCAQPRSRGSVKVLDISTRVPPAVDPGYLRDGWDVQCMVKALRRAERLVSSPPFQEIGARVHWPRPERCRALWRYSKDDQLGVVRRKKDKTTTSRPPVKDSRPPDAYLECIIREIAVTGHHVGGTCAGGTVVDHELRLKSVRGVRVVDASVLPAPASLFPNSVLVAVAERAADIIRNRI